MLHDKRIKYFAPADYTEGSKLDLLVKAIIDHTTTNEVLENIHFECKEERDQNDIRKRNNESKRKKLDLILSLDGSRSFATTHTVIKDLLKFNTWEDDEIDMLLDIAINNKQVNYILNDLDVKAFYQLIINQMNNTNEKTKTIEAAFE